MSDMEIAYTIDDVTHAYGVYTTNRSEGKNFALKHHNGVAPASTHDNIIDATKKVQSFSNITQLQTAAMTERASKRRLNTRGLDVDDSIVRHLTEPTAEAILSRLESAAGRTVHRLAPPLDGRPFVRSHGAGEIFPLKPPIVVSFKVDAMWSVSSKSGKDRFAPWSSKGKKKYQPDEDCKTCCPNFFKETFVFGMKTGDGYKLMCCHRRCNDGNGVCVHCLAVQKGQICAEDCSPFSLRSLHNGDLDDVLFSKGIPVVPPTRTFVPLRVPVDAHPFLAGVGPPMQGPASAVADSPDDSKSKKKKRKTGVPAAAAGGRFDPESWIKDMARLARSGNLNATDLAAIRKGALAREIDNQEFARKNGAMFSSGNPHRPGQFMAKITALHDRKGHARNAKKKK